ncbi:hypothetical protein O181_004132 [Austropuccinia psidii MF-1]|uniref:Uncharacterized protein n=1 Tax=Austropuccinia psidii MF-1 TaxID=1389203 RepID=A0A9Q3BG65_9BASI|nr:hypothetical protein [Austropuccinia psidii MF-1]
MENWDLKLGSLHVQILGTSSRGTDENSGPQGGTYSTSEPKLGDIIQLQTSNRGRYCSSRPQGGYIVQLQTSNRATYRNSRPQVDELAETPELLKEGQSAHSGPQ